VRGNGRVSGHEELYKVRESMISRKEGVRPNAGNDRKLS